jgi:hypothetical protein
MRKRRNVGITLTRSEVLELAIIVILGLAVIIAGVIMAVLTSWHDD